MVNQIIIYIFVLLFDVMCFVALAQSSKRKVAISVKQDYTLTSFLINNLLT